MNRLRIALLAGGWSRERKVSLRSGQAVYEALDKAKYHVLLYDPCTDLQALFEARKQITLALILLHGRFGEDGCIQGLLNILGIPFVGSDVLSSAMALNKRVAKERYRSAGLNVAKDVVVTRAEGCSLQEIRETLGPVTVVKPVAEGSSLGMSLCHTQEELSAGIENAFQYDEEVLVEEFISGREVSTCVLGNRQLWTLPIVEIVPRAPYGFFDYEAKYTAGGTEEICPALISPLIAETVRFCAEAAHKALKCRVWSRTDMIIRDETVYLLETNTIPGMTENSLFPLAARAAGLSLSELLDTLISLSLEVVD
jgi:D-alanine-D-alanine ligase